MTIAHPSPPVDLSPYDAACEALATLATAHHGGHHCMNAAGTTSWFNQAAKPDSPRCAVLTGLLAVRASVNGMQAEVEGTLRAVHDAAHDNDAIEYVTRAMLAGSDLSPMHPEEQEAWRTFGRLAIEGVASWCDPTVDTSHA